MKGPRTCSALHNPLELQLELVRRQQGARSVRVRRRDVELEEHAVPEAEHVNRVHSRVLIVCHIRETNRSTTTNSFLGCRTN